MSKILDLLSTTAEIDAATPAERRAFYQALITLWEANSYRQNQADAEADQRAAELGIVNESPIDGTRHYARSGTNRSTNE